MSKDELIALIPDYLEDRLSELDKENLLSAIANDSDLAAELDFQKNIKSALNIDTAINDYDELGWARLSKEMNVDAMSAIPSANDNIGQPKFWRYAAAFLMVAVLGQSIFIGSNLKGESQDRYLPVTQAPVQAHILKVEFAQNLLLTEMAETLQELNGNIISGPSKIGLYQLSFTSEDSLIEAERFFRENPDMVLSQGRP